MVRNAEMYFNIENFQDKINVYQQEWFRHIYGWNQETRDKLSFIFERNKILIRFCKL